MNRLLLAAALGAAAATPALAQPAPTLTVYTYSSFAGEYGPGATVAANFEAMCDCALEWVVTDDAGTLIARLLLEGASTPADIVLGLDTSLMEEARASGLFAPHGITLEGLDLPVAWTDDTFVPFDWGWFAFVYDSETLAAAPASLRELVTDPDGPTIIIEDPRTSSPGLGLLLWMKEVFGDGAADAWAQLAPRIVTVTRGWSEAYGLFLEGEADMVLSYTTSPAYHLIAEGEDRYEAAIFEEGHALQVEVGAMVASTDQPQLAREFLDFMLTDGFQAAIPEGNWMYPATIVDVPAVFADLPRPAMSFLTAPADLVANREAWINEWLGALAP
ncbi:MAG: thiamine ABC transporter substrate binding subunit [Bauldia sp.]